jgi:hypothetical protein
MGTGNTISYNAKTKPSSGNVGSKNTPNMSPFFYGVVTYVNAETRAIQFTTLKNNIGPVKLGDAVPSYKDNITLPQLDDVVPLFIGPSFESSLLGEQDTSTVYYLNPISNLQELDKNGLVRSSKISASPDSVNPSKMDYKMAQNGFIK